MLLGLGLALLAGSGCTRNLMIQPDDWAVTRVAKVTARVPLAVLSLGQSERLAACVRSWERVGLSVEPESPAWGYCTGAMCPPGQQCANSVRCYSRCTSGLGAYCYTQCK